MDGREEGGITVFVDRVDAGRQLAAMLEGSVEKGALVLGIPRGGVIVAAEVARALDLDLDVEVVRKIGAPGNPEFAIAAVDADGVIIGDPSGLADEAYIRRAAEEARQEIERRLAVYRGDRPAPAIAGRPVLLVDDGVATGLTLSAAVHSLRRRGASHITVAAPVASPSAEEALRRIADQVVIIWVDPLLRSVSQYYDVFDQTSDEEVIQALQDVWDARERSHGR